jgi:hypothetical protein
MENPRKDKKIIKLWLTEEEERIFKYSLKELGSYYEKVVFSLLLKAKERGDLE